MLSWGRETNASRLSISVMSASAMTSGSACSIRRRSSRARRRRRVEQSRCVVDLELGPFLWRRPALQDRCRLSGAHDRELSPGPRNAQVVAHLLRVHHDVFAAVALAQDDADPRTVARPYAAPVARRDGSSRALEVLAGIEARGVDERHDRQVEGVAERDQRAAFCEAGMSSVPARANGLFATIPTAGHPSRRTPSRRWAPIGCAARTSHRRRRSP